MSYKYIFGPVVSRRLGLSLGIDIIPRKYCSLDCIYCQVARTDHLCSDLAPYICSEDVISEIEDFLKNGGKADAISFVGSGEPLLNIELGIIIEEVKKMTDIPVVLITNGTLLYKKEARENALKADMVMPNLDAGLEEVFKKINRPHESIKFDEMIEGLIQFSKVYKGELHIEVFILPGINSHKENVEAIAEIIGRMDNVKGIEINTTARPSHDESAIEADRKIIDEVAKILSTVGKVKVIENYKKTVDAKTEKTEITEDEIQAIIGRHPSTIEELTVSLGVEKEILQEKLDDLEAFRKVVKGKNGHYRKT